MKKWNMLYDNCKLPIRIVCFAFILVAIGYYVQNDNVNIFYTITNPNIILLAQTLGRIGYYIIINIPLIFLINLVAKRANSGMPALLAIIGYLTFLIVTMFYNEHDLTTQAYTGVLGINYSVGSDVIYPIQTGMIGSFMIAFITRYAYLKSRKKSIYSFFGFLHEDTRAILYNVVLCGLCGIVTVLVWPYFINFISGILVWIAEDISDPIRLSIYGFLDRVMSILGLGNIVRYPFWYGVSGGTYASLSGNAVLGDVSIWSYMPEALLTYNGAGRFITPYYVINMFMAPAMYLGFYFTCNDKKERHRHLLFVIAACIFSILCGNPLIIELILLFTSPLLLFIHLGLSASLFGLLFINNAFLGFKYAGSTLSAMPGAFCDYIINIRSPEYLHSVIIILLVGIIYAIITFIATRVYYRYLAYDLTGSNKSKIIAVRIFDAVGGVNNISQVTSTVFNLSIELKDLELVSYDEIKKVGAKNIVETKTSLILDFGSASTVIRANILKEMKKYSRIQ